MYDLRVIVAVVVLHLLDIRTCIAEIVHKLYCNISMMLWSPSSGQKSTEMTPGIVVYTTFRWCCDHLHQKCFLTATEVHFVYVWPITSPPERPRLQLQPRTERPRLQLQPRTKPLNDTSGRRERGGGGGGGGRNSSSIFGQAKPVDTAARDREIEERLLRVSTFS